MPTDRAPREPADGEPGESRGLQELIDLHAYRAPTWLPNRHLQTAWGPLFRRARLRLAPECFRLERLQTPDDDFIRIHHLEVDSEQPTVLVLHGLEGSLRSHNVLGIAAETRERLGWNVVVMEHRSCGGELNRARRLYHSGETSDLAWVVDRLAARGSDRLYLFGVSLGGNVLAKWLGEESDSVPSSVRAAAVLCPPFDLTVSGPHIDKAALGLYTRRFLRTLVPKALAKERQYPGCLDRDKVAQSRTFRDFDTYATAAVHGFRDAEHYWEVVGCGQFLPLIRRPTLLIAAEDDPFNPASTLPRQEVAANPCLFSAFSARGAHTGFVTGSPLQSRCWGEEQAARFFGEVERRPGNLVR